eukprot:976788-Alexandrium_andersonii.AAC.1
MCMCTRAFALPYSHASMNSGSAVPSSPSDTWLEWHLPRLAPWCVGRHREVWARSEGAQTSR